jgi:hypothetical protein
MAMKTTMKTSLAALLALAASMAMAQAASAPQASGPAASAPRMGMGPGGGMGMGGGRMGAGRMGGAARAGADYTPGWGLMTPAERNEHRTQMRSAKSYEDCVALRDKHHELMLARAKERGITMPAQPRRDACQGLKR